MDLIAGYVAAGLIGIALGLLGGGGSILTVPVLVYCFHINPTLATAYSLFIVGATSLVGGVRSAMSELVDFRAAALFSVPSFVGVYLTRRYMLPLIPEHIAVDEHFLFTRDGALMMFFALLMFGAGVSMIMRRSEVSTSAEGYHFWTMVAQGFCLGIVTGIVGAGGGFLIVPALVLMAGVPMKKAVGTSLIVIAVKSLIGFVGDLQGGQQIDFVFMTVISSIAICGIFFGGFIANYVEPARLKNIFGWAVIGMSVMVLAREIVMVIR